MTSELYNHNLGALTPFPNSPGNHLNKSISFGSMLVLEFPEVLVTLNLNLQGEHETL